MKMLINVLSFAIGLTIMNAFGVSDSALIGYFCGFVITLSYLEMRKID